MTVEGEMVLMMRMSSLYTL